MPSCSTSTAARLLVGLQRFGLAAGLVKGEHQVPMQSLAPRMLGHESAQLADQLARAPEPEIGIDALLDRLEPQLLEPLQLPRQRALQGQLRQGRASP